MPCAGPTSGSLVVIVVVIVVVIFILVFVVLSFIVVIVVSCFADSFCVGLFVAQSLCFASVCWRSG